MKKSLLITLFLICVLCITSCNSKQQIEEIEITESNFRYFFDVRFDLTNVVSAENLGLNYSAAIADLNVIVSPKAPGSFKMVKATVKIDYGNSRWIASDSSLYLRTDYDGFRITFNIPSNGSFSDVIDLESSYNNPDSNWRPGYSIKNVAGSYIPAPNEDVSIYLR